MKVRYQGRRETFPLNTPNKAAAAAKARAREGRFDAQQRLALRQAEAGPSLEKIKTLALEARKAALPRSRLAEGCDYLADRNLPATPDPAARLL